ncbi:MAG: hypothetical protein LBU11_09665 [Zoogloeaceae bacterium]|nr:hypothetical protein [Zoogloeaceae bacterium]
MRDNRRRNRNIGTARQGHGQNNRMVIPDPFYYTEGFRWYFERLTQYKKFTRLINGHEFTFVVEETRADCRHACSVEDVAYMLEHIPVADYGDLHLIVFRQPKRKEKILSPVWGRLIFTYTFEQHDYAPAVILEAFSLSGSVRRSRRLSVEERHELERLQGDGLDFTADRRNYQAPLTRETARAVQLYRTLPHEFGHYAQYRQILETPGPDLASMDEHELQTYFHESIPALEKEKFAHAYADRMNAEWRKKGSIPFPPREDQK